MDIKNLIIVLLAAALGITALEATNVIDLLNNNGTATSNIKVNYVSTDSIKLWQTQRGKPMCSTGKREGYFFAADELITLMAESQTDPSQTLKGIMVFPYIDNTGDLNIYLGVTDKGYISPKFCPNVCTSW
jgi:hypothetical protein